MNEKRDQKDEGDSRELLTGIGIIITAPAGFTKTEMELFTPRRNLGTSYLFN